MSKLDNLKKLPKLADKAGSQMAAFNAFNP